MSYRITYPGTGSPGRRIRIVPTAVMSAVFCISFLWAAGRISPEAGRVLDILKSGSVSLFPADALETMVHSVRTGTNLQEAVTDFCRDVVRRGLSFAG